jgi:mono/diheme cytochrome c family protein
MGGVSRRDAGHDLFHTNAGAGLACASCHPGGGDDGRTWQFSDVGPRRTQVFNMGIDDTLPLHWDGELATFSDLVDEVFVRRMGGPNLTVDQRAALGGWIASMKPNTPMRKADDPAVVRGKQLFQSSDVGCSGCHSGKKLTNNATIDVGTGGAFQVPSLIGVAYGQPYLHDGCAQSLRQRFDPKCGGAQHGHTSQLSEAQIGDLIAYLQSL